MPGTKKVKLERTRDVARIWLDRPDVHNAFDDEVIAALAAAVDEANQHPRVRVIVLGGRGRSFSAGADLEWMRRAAGWTPEQNSQDAARLAGMLRALAASPKVTVARVHGAAVGGGMGLVAACDMAIASERARFGLSEVKLGLIPAVISPHVIEKVGVGRARALFVTGQRFDAAFAERIGLVARVVPDEEALDLAIEEVIAEVRTSGPDAVRAAKELVRIVPTLTEDQVDAWTAEQIAGRRATPEAREGMAAFLEKRAPAWVARRDDPSEEHFPAPEDDAEEDD
ncbi:MAG: enoyl-CoA hydratase/isomerase family protein [Planctomycetes bacterium]|nr:enoyl-CoA hydratase/isomerase family protein [Planctomycetota bacterium]